MESRVHDDGKSEARNQLLETIDEGAVSIRKEMGREQRQQLMAPQRLTACMQSGGVQLVHVPAAITLKLNFLVNV